MRVDNRSFEQKLSDNFVEDQFKKNIGDGSGSDNTSSSGKSSPHGTGDSTVSPGSTNNDNENDIHTNNNYATSNQNMAAMYMQAMMMFYTANSNDMMNKGDEMAAQTANSQHLSDIQVQIANAQSAAGSGNVTISTGGSNTYVTGSGNGTTLYISASDEQFLENYGIDCNDGNMTSTQMSSLDQAVNDEEETLSGANEQLLLDVQLASQNMSQAASAATSGMSGIGQSLSSTASKIGG